MTIFWTYDNFLNLQHFTCDPRPVTHDTQQLDTPITDQVLMRVCG